MTRTPTAIFLLVTALALPLLARAESLIEVFQLAQRNDPAIREAEANMLAIMQGSPRARAGLLPQLDANANWNRTQADGTQAFNFGAVNTPPFNFTNDTDAWGWSLDFRQPLFDMDQWRQLKRADRQGAQAEVDYQAAMQDLSVRVAEAYFNVLAAQDQLGSERASKDAIGRQLEQAQRRFEVGLIAITDVKEAQAAFDDAVALEIAAQRQLAAAKEALREITGEYPQTLAAPDEEFPLIPPDPQVEQDWVDVALQYNLALESARINSEITRETIEIARSGHLPTLDFVASYGNSRADGEGKTLGVPIDNPQPGEPPVRDLLNLTERDIDQFQFGVQFNLPIFAGGGVSAEVKEQVYRHRAALENYERAARETERNTRDAYLGVIAEIARVQALARAEDSNQTALEATEAGYEVGTRTTVDVLLARQNLFLTETQYARAKYDYMVNVLKLKAAAGTLTVDDVIQINSWLNVEETLPETPGRGAAPDVNIPEGTPTKGGLLDAPIMAEPDGNQPELPAAPQESTPQESP